MKKFNSKCNMRQWVRRAGGGDKGHSCFVFSSHPFCSAAVVIYVCVCVYDICMCVYIHTQIIIHNIYFSEALGKKICKFKWPNWNFSMKSSWPKLCDALDTAIWCLILDIKIPGLFWFANLSKWLHSFQWSFLSIYGEYPNCSDAVILGIVKST